jgi:hypothetical protein
MIEPVNFILSSPALGAQSVPCRAEYDLLQYRGAPLGALSAQVTS